MQVVTFPTPSFPASYLPTIKIKISCSVVTFPPNTFFHFEGKKYTVGKFQLDESHTVPQDPKH